MAGEGQKEEGRSRVFWCGYQTHCNDPHTHGFTNGPWSEVIGLPESLETAPPKQISGGHNAVILLDGRIHFSKFYSQVLIFENYQFALIFFERF